MKTKCWIIWECKGSTETIAMLALFRDIAVKKLKQLESDKEKAKQGYTYKATVEYIGSDKK